MEPVSLNKLRWQCRRGMLELDVFLQTFLEHSYPNLDENKQAAFVRLLACEDQDLFVWLTGKVICEDAELQALVEQIRADVARVNA